MKNVKMHLCFKGLERTTEEEVPTVSAHSAELGTLHFNTLQKKLN